MKLEISVAFCSLIVVQASLVLPTLSSTTNAISSLFCPDPNRQTPQFDLTKIVFPISLPYNASDPGEVSFVLYSPQNPTNGQNIGPDNKSLANSFFNKAYPTKFVIHGWFCSQFTPSIADIRRAYIKLGNYNVIMVDWSSRAMTGDYSIVRPSINETAVVVAKLINFLIANGFTDYQRCGIVGHSLGGQMAGLIAKLILGGKLQTIVALDPAGPLFNNTVPAGIITKNDAVYVEVIHTSIKGVGFAAPLGTADFYPNFGYNQPGCPCDFTHICSHFRATNFYAESLNNPDQFYAQKCASFDEISQNQCTVLSSGYLMGGEPSYKNISGVFYLPTNANPPYAVSKGKTGLAPVLFGDLTNFVVGFIIIVLTFLRAVLIGLKEAFRKYA